MNKVKRKEGCKKREEEERNEQEKKKKIKDRNKVSGKIRK